MNNHHRFPATSENLPSAHIWSATPTPLTSDLRIDEAALQRTVDRHISLQANGVMFGGTCGEGPWLRRIDLITMAKVATERAGTKVELAFQVTDNSPAQILDRLEELAAQGVRYGVLAQPYFFMNGTPQRMSRFYAEVLDRSPIPIILYDRGNAANVPIPSEILGELLAHPRIVSIKDSSCDGRRFEIMKNARSRRDSLAIMTGNEFKLIESLHDGYDGVFFGGLILTGMAVRRVVELFRDGDMEAAAALDHEARQLLLDVYGGKSITCWLSGLKYALTGLGIFSGWKNIPDYPLTEECRQAVDEQIAKSSWLKAGEGMVVS